jgi:hypothetical protein
VHHNRTGAMKTISTAILLFIALNSNAQKQLIGIKAGAVQANVQSSGVFEDADRRLGIELGLTFDYFLTKHISLGVELLYQERGMTEYVSAMNNSGFASGELYPIKFRYDYVCLPIKASYVVGKKFQGFGSLGLVPGRLLSAKTIVPVFDGDSKYMGDQKLVATEFVRKFDLAGMLEVGAGYEIKKRYRIYGAVAYQNSFTTITGSNYFPEMSIRHELFSGMVGVKVRLKD